MKILFLPKYNQQGPSSRYRIYQYLEFYKREGLEVTVSPLFGTRFFVNNKLIKICYTLYYYFRRFFKLLGVFQYDLVYIEYELFPYFPAVFEKLLRVTNGKYIVDYDDAIFHNYNKSKHNLIRVLLSNKIDSVIKNASYVITGSPYLTEYVSKLNTNYVEIPTSVSRNKYTSISDSEKNAIFTLGWIGSRTTSVNLLNLIPAFEELSKKIKFQLNLIGFDEGLSHQLSHLNVNFVKWNAETEIQEIKKFDVGIMPLENTPFNQGKCGFKLIQYMGCSLPTIATPLEANVKINRSGKNLHAITTEDWVDAFKEIHQNRDYYKAIGKENFNDFEKFYTVENNSETYVKIFKEVKYK
ncbi:glycosyltransferase [Flavobacterium nackdongense]|uniref:Glycosyltransferase family 1 protein n=1 Tax=Flavobacterium nackdongense TaxID=2547394 RepID=A0A4V1AH01_9FLAO|nr:glycosyltransferase [Flavobacterium nackdongense]QBN19822.1 glycosyltransferase family 1 protein [Flavobacterium nackdongense]